MPKNKERTVLLCTKNCCPAVKITDKQVEIGEEGNLCILNKKEWNTLKKKILNKEL